MKKIPAGVLNTNKLCRKIKHKQVISPLYRIPTHLQRLVSRNDETLADYHSSPQAGYAIMEGVALNPPQLLVVGA